jgi:hypothetical protein
MLLDAMHIFFLSLEFDIFLEDDCIPEKHTKLGKSIQQMQQIICLSPRAVLRLW